MVWYCHYFQLLLFSFYIYIQTVHSNSQHHLKQQKQKRTVESPYTVDSPENIPQTPEMNVEIPNTADSPDSKSKIPAKIQKRSKKNHISSSILTKRKRTDIDKRTHTPDTVDTPDMDVDTPNTPDTPELKIKVNNTKDTPESSGFQFSGDDDAGYTEVENGHYKQVHYISNPFANLTESAGDVKVQWKPFNKNTSRINVHSARMGLDTDIEAKTADEDADNKNMIGEEAQISLDKEKAKSFENATFDNTMLDYFFNQYNKRSRVPKKIPV